MNIRATVIIGGVSEIPVAQFVFGGDAENYAIMLSREISSPVVVETTYSRRTFVKGVETELVER